MAPLRALVLALVLSAAASAAPAATITIRAAGSSDLNVDTLLAVGDGSLDLEIVLDTQGLTFEGYSYGLAFSGSTVSISDLALTHQPLTGLIADAFGSPVIDSTAATIRNVNQAKLSAGPGLAAGVYVLDSLSFTVTGLETDALVLSGDLYGEVFGLGQGSCPGTVAGCNVHFHALQIVPEPSSAILLAAGLGVLAARRRRRSLAR